MANLNGHEAGNGGHRQGTPKASCAFLYSEYYYVKYLGTTRALCFCPAVGTEACPGEEQVLNLTTRPWQGPPRSFFYCEAFPELEMRAPT